MTKGRSTLILLAGIVVLGTFIFIQETWRAKVPSKEYRRIQLFDLSPDTLVSIQFKYTNTVVDCVKDNGVWMTGGSERELGRADVAMIHKMVAGLNSIGKGTTITAEHLEMRGIDAAEYGLANSALRISAVDNKGRHTWWIGRKAPLGKMLYAKIGNGDDIYTIPARLLDIVPTQPDELRDRTLFSGKTTGTRRIELRGSSGFVQILNDSKEGWKIQQPLVAPADPQAVEGLLENLYRLRIEDFESENVSDFAIYGLQGEARQIALGGADDTSRMLVIGDEISGRPGMVYARRTDDTSVFALKAEVLDLLNIKLNELRDVRVLPLPAKDISYISVTRGTEQIELVQGESNSWTLTKPVSWEADARAVGKVLKFWDTAVITEFDETNTTFAVEWTLLFGSEGLGETNRIDILSTLGERNGLLIRRNGEPTVCRINLPRIPDSILDPLEYKDRTLWTLQPENIQKISVKKSKHPRQVIERLADGTFAVEATNATVQVDQGMVGIWLNELAEVSTSGYVIYNPRDLSIYGLADPAVTLHVGLAGTNQLGRVLLIGQEAAEGFYAMVKGRDVVFILDKTFVNMLSAGLIVEPEPIVPNTDQ